MARKTTGKTAAETAAENDETQDAATDEGGAGTGTPALTKRDLIGRVVAASGVKKKAAKPVVEALLKELGDALSRGETLNLQPLGKGIVKNRKELENAEIIELRLRRSKIAVEAAQAAADAIAVEAEVSPDPLAEAAE